MKMSTIKLASVFTLSLFLSMTEAEAATFAGQSCVTRNKALTYSTGGAQNNSDDEIYISCPVTRNKDNTYGAMSAVVYFVDDAKKKTCFLDNFNIKTSDLWTWTSASGTERLELPELSYSKPLWPVTLNCKLPAGSKVTGYQFTESE